MKNHAKLKLAEWWRQAKADAGELLPVIIHKRHNVADPAQQWATMDMDTFTTLIETLRELQGTRGETPRPTELGESRDGFGS